MKMIVLQTDLGVTPAYKKQPPRRASSWVAGAGKAYLVSLPLRLGG